MTERLQHIALGIIRRAEDVLLIERRRKETGTIMGANCKARYLRHKLAERTRRGVPRH